MLNINVPSDRYCAICWRWFGAGTRWRQTVEGISRDLCESCFSRMFPVLPKGLEGSDVVHIDAKAALKSADVYASDAEARAGYDAWLDGYERGKAAALKGKQA